MNPNNAVGFILIALGAWLVFLSFNSANTVLDFLFGAIAFVAGIILIYRKPSEKAVPENKSLEGHDLKEKKHQEKHITEKIDEFIDNDNSKKKKKIVEDIHREEEEEQEE